MMSSGGTLLYGFIFRSTFPASMFITVATKTNSITKHDTEWPAPCFSFQLYSHEIIGSWHLARDLGVRSSCNIFAHYMVTSSQCSDYFFLLRSY